MTVEKDKLDLKSSPCSAEPVHRTTKKK
jgi:hypothetical protein